MALETRLIQKLSQSLLMTPQLQQAIKLLQLGRLEYLEAIAKELLDNPLLEEVREDDSRADKSNTAAQEGSAPAESSGSDDSTYSPQSSEQQADTQQPQSALEDPKMDWEDYLESFSDSRGAATPKGLIDFEDRPPLENAVTRTESLTEYLMGQIRMSDLSPDDESLAAYIIGNLDKDGYLREERSAIAQACGVSMEAVDSVLSLIRSLDPPGIGASDLKECLILQLEHQGLGEELAARIIQNHLDKLEKRRYDLIAKNEQVAVEEVYNAVKVIRQLEPRPGRSFSDDSARYIVPDVYVYKVGSEYVVSLNEDGLPKLRVSPYYLKLLKGEGDENAPNKTYLNERLKAASWLIRSIQQRQQTILKVTQSIVKFQKPFLDHGISKLRPLVLKDVAEDIGMHESTVSRVTTDKYVHTPQGVFELKYFFSTGIRTTEGEVSSSTIKEKIRSLIAAESPEDPISDQAIVDILKKENISIARRTVAKYREGLGIPSSSQRKKHF